MTTKTKTEAHTFDPEAHYEVGLSAVVEWRGKKISPGKHNVLRGDVCEALKDSIVSYERV